MDVGEMWGKLSWSPTSALGICASRSHDLSKWKKLRHDFNSALEVSEVLTRPVRMEHPELLHRWERKHSS